MRNKKSWKRLMALVLSAAMLIPAQAAYATEGKEAETGMEAYKESRAADADGFEIENGVLKKYTGTAAEVVIPEGVTSIDYRAFGVRSSLLKSISIPGSVTSIEEGAFNDCSSLEVIKVEEGNAVYDSREDCNAVIETESNELIVGCKNTIIPGSVTSIGSSAFSGCSSLTEITIPEGVTSIGRNAFIGCSGLTEITIPKGVTSIGMYAFNRCSGLTEITIPKGVTSIKEGVFSDCSGLAVIKVEEGNARYDSRENCNAIIETESNEIITGCKNTIIPGSVTSIGEETFRGCSDLTEISIPEGVTSIGEYAFEDCISLTEISIPEGVTSIGNGAFGGCSGLTEISIPEGVTSIRHYAFEDCSSLKSISIPGSVTNIGEEAFRGCRCLTEISIPGSVTSIGWHAFEDCSSLTEITISEGVRIIEDGAFRRCISLKSISIPGSVTNIGEVAFVNCSGLEVINVEAGNPVYDSREDCNAIIHTESNGLVTGCKNTIIPGSVASIVSSAFSGCSGLTEITIPEGVTSIGNSAFYGCSGLTSITISESVTSIRRGAFGKNSSLEVINVEAGNPVYDSRENCNAIIETESNELITGCKNTIIPGSVMRIGSSAFEGCSGLTEISIPEGVTSILETSFSGCSSLAVIEVEAGNPVYDSREDCNAIITTESNELIVGCKNTIIPGSVMRIGNTAFSGCSGLTEISIPEGVTSIGDSAFSGCSSLEVIKVEAQNPVYDSREDCNAVIETESNELIVGCKNTIIPESVTKIRHYVFEGCSGLTEISIPEGVANIGDNVFYKCDNLTLLVIRGSYAEAYAKSWGIKYKYTGECSHEYEDRITTEAGCVSEGVLTHTCKLCQDSYTESIPAMGHKEVTDAAVAATCTREGKTEGKHCSVCNAVIKVQETVPAAGHKEVTDAAVAATCTGEGKTEGKHCSVCNAVIKVQETVPAVGHNYRTDTTAATTKKNGSITQTCTVCGDKKEPETIYAVKTVNLSKTSYNYNKKVQKPTITVKDSKGKVLRANIDYTVSYPKGMINVGSYTVTVRFKGSYSGTVEKEFTIAPTTTSISKVTPNKKGFVLKWKKQAEQTTGYEIAYSTNKNFIGKTSKTITEKKVKTTSKTVSELAAGKKYFVRIRTYKTVKFNGKSAKIYSAWSKSKTVTTKK